MRVRVDFKESVRTASGSFRYAEGELDPVQGILWLEKGKNMRGDVVATDKRHVGGARRCGVHLPSRVYFEELPPLETTGQTSGTGQTSKPAAQPKKDAA